MEPSKTSPVRYEAELTKEFADLLAHDSRLEQFSLNSCQRPTEALLVLDGREFRFCLSFLLSPTIERVAAARVAGATPPLFVVPRLTPAFLQACQRLGVSVADLNGQIFLRGPGLFVSLPSLPDRRFRFKLEPRNAFAGKSARIVRTLLTDPERFWRQSELIERTGATSGLVSRIVTHFTRQGLLQKMDPRRFRVPAPLALLDAWAQADNFARRTTTYRYAALNGDLLKMAKSIHQLLTDGGPPFAFTQWLAAWLRHPYAEPAVVSLYVSQLPSQEILDQLGLHPVNEAGRVWFHIPADEGVFLERRHADDLPLVSDAQIYLDLLKTGLRGPEQAQALREWPGFCRP
jgi:hypothetical protein